MVGAALHRDKIVQFFHLVPEVLVFELESFNPFVVLLYYFLGAVG